MPSANAIPTILNIFFFFNSPAEAMSSMSRWFRRINLDFVHTPHRDGEFYVIWSKSRFGFVMNVIWMECALSEGEIEMRRMECEGGGDGACMQNES